jgi:hypothetical protein
VFAWQQAKSARQQQLEAQRQESQGNRI